MIPLIRNLCAYMLLLLCIVDAEISNPSGEGESLILKAINDSAYFVKVNKGSNHQNISDPLYFIIEPSNLNTIIEKSFSADAKGSPLRKREILFHVNHPKSKKSENAHGFVDDLFTLYFDENVNGSNPMLSRPKKESGEEYYRKISDTLQKSSSEERKPISVISSLKDKTPKAIQKKEKSDITVIPMPLLTNSHDENVAEIDSVSVGVSEVALTRSEDTLTRPEEASDIENIFRSNNLNEEKTIKQTTLDVTYNTAEPIYAPSIFSSEDDFSSTSHTSENPLNTESNDKVKTEYEQIVTQESNFLPSTKDTEERIMSTNLAESLEQADRQHINNVVTNKELLEYDSNIDYDSETSTTKQIPMTDNNDLKESKMSSTNTTILTSSETTTTTTTGISLKDIFGHERFHNHTHLVRGSKESTSTTERFSSRKNSTITTTPFSPWSRTPDLSLAEVKIIPVQEREYTLLLSGIILCSLGVFLIIGALIIYFYQKKKSSSNEIEMMSSIRFEEEA